MTETPLRLQSGYTVLPITLLTLPAIAALFVAAVSFPMGGWTAFFVIVLALAFVGWIIHLAGYVVVNPNEAIVVQLFGSYVGTLKDVGFFWGNPFYTKTKTSLRVQTFETGMTGTSERQPSKVNDKDGTPIEIAAVVVYRVVNAADAVLQVDAYKDFVHLQSDAALRNLASRYHYDGPEADEHTLRSHIEEVALQLRREIQERLVPAGVEIIEARISYLAYAPEIAASMLQRQQAGAIIAARQKIVEGAVGMVEHALELLEQKNVIKLDGERRAAMVSNLLVVLCGHTVPQPVITTGGSHSAGN